MIISAPIFPHLTEEIWSQTGHEYSIHMQNWPKVDEKLLKENEIEIPVQINGKVRGKIYVLNNETEEEVREKVLLDKALADYLKDKELKKFIYVPGRIINIVV